MDEIDKAVIMADFLANKKECCLCKRQADDVYIAKFEDAHKNADHFVWPICHVCLAEIGDMFSEWVPMFCIECSKAGWLQRNADVPDNAHAGFVDGCDDECTGVRKRGWWLARDAFNC